MQNLRRMERIYDKGPNLQKINKSLLEHLSNIFSEEFVVFNDKYNAKPPNGEVFLRTTMEYISLG